VEDEDSRLVQQTLDGDKETFRALVDKYKRPIYNLAYRILGNVEDANDVAQETFLCAYRSLDTFDLKRNFSPWIFKIATNLCFDRLRKKKLNTVSIDDPISEEDNIRWQLPDSSMDPQNLYESKELQDVVQRLIASLPEKYRAVIVMRHSQGLSYEEIAEILDQPVGTVKTHLHRARKILQEKLAILSPSLIEE